MWNSFINKFGLSKKPAVQDQPITTRTTLYVKKDGNDYMVSHLALGGGYAEYNNKKENGSDCWTSDGVSPDTAFGDANVSANPPVVVPIMVKDTLIATTKCEGKNPDEYKKSSSDSDMKVAIMKHVRIRFAQLECILDANSDVKVIIGGGTVDGNYTFVNDGGETKPTLGRKLAVDQWKSHSETQHNGENEGNEVADEIENLWKKLEKKYKSEKRLFIGAVGFDHAIKETKVKKSREKEKTDFGIANLDPSDKLIHVWGANINNFDKSNHGGGGQADSMQHSKEETNPAGAFGIITTPVGATAQTIEVSNDELLKLFTGDSAGGSKPRNRTRSKKRRNSRKSK